MRTVVLLANRRLAVIFMIRRARRALSWVPAGCADFTAPDRKHPTSISMLPAWYVLACLALWGGGDWTEAQGGSGAPPSNRYLLIVETSQNMQPRAPAAVTAIRELLSGSLASQMRAGDSVGVWTFDEALHTGEFPLQRWTPESAKALAQKVALFVAGKTFDKSAALEKVLPAVKGIAARSEFITVVLISCGEDLLTGTPFDAAINQTFKSWQECQRKAQMPFVTVLRAKRGQLTDFAVTPLPWPVELPPFPAELLARRQTQPGSVDTGTNRAPAALIFSGKKAPSTNVTGSTAVTPQTTSLNVSNQIVAQPPAEVTASSPVPERAPVQREPATPPEVAPAVATPPSPAEVQKREPVPSPPVAPTVVETSNPSVAVAEKPTPQKRDEPKPPAGHPRVAVQQPAPAATPPQVAAATGPQPLLKRTITRLLFLGVAVFAFGGLLLLFFRKPRLEPRGSVITRSLDKEQK